jgi:hypothetical protein
MSPVASSSDLEVSELALQDELQKQPRQWKQSLALALVILGFTVAVAAIFYRSSLLPAWRDWRIQAAEYIFILSASIALIALYAGFAQRWNLRKCFEFPGLIFPSALLLAAGVYKLGMHQFGGWDQGLLVHAGTYYAQGFKPYVDFPCSMPPLFMAGVRFGVSLLGLKWSSFSFLAAAFTALTTLWIFALLRAASMPRHVAIAVTICAELSTMWVTPFWWFNNTSAVSVVLLFLSVLACLRQPKPLLHWVSLSLSLGMVLASKPNDLPACLMVLALVATTDKQQWAKTLAACAGALAIFLAICRGANMPLRDLLNSYAEIGKLRGSPLLMLPIRALERPERNFQIGLILLAALCFAVLLTLSVKRYRCPWPTFFVFLIAGVTSMEMTFTNSEIKTSDLCVILIAAVFLCINHWKVQEVSATRRVLLAGWLSVFLVMSGFLAVIHLRTLSIGELMFYEPLPTTTIQSGFFAGLEAGPRLQRVLRQTEMTLSYYPSQKVFFGPRMESMYAAFNKPVTPGMPLLWDPGNLFPKERLPGMVATFQQDDPDLLIFLKDDSTRMDIMFDYIARSGAYAYSEDLSDITVFVRQKQVRVTDVSANIHQ